MARKRTCPRHLLATPLRSLANTLLPSIVNLAAIPTPLLCGPTAGGKSALAVDLAIALRDQRRIHAEIVTADAFQIYTGLDIGTAKPTLVEQRGIPHHLLNIVDPRSGALHHRAPSASTRADSAASSPAALPLQTPYTPFTLDRWLTLAEQAIADIRARGAIPIVVGGTHLYVKALLDGLFQGPEPDPTLRAELNAMDPAARRTELERVDPQAAARIHSNDIRRTLRALEVFRQTGKPISAHQTQWDRVDAKNRPLTTERGGFLLALLDWPTELINPRINARVKHMIERGLVAEARALFDSGALGPQAIEALGYKQLIPHFRAQSSLDDAIEHIKIETRRFAKNQRTWLRRLRSRPDSLPIDAQATPPETGAELIARRLMPD